MNSTYRILDPLTPHHHTLQGKCALGVMIKAPRAGASKTRLVPPLTHDEAAQLSLCFLRDTTANIASVAASNTDGADLVDGVAVYTPHGAEAAFDDLLPRGFSLLAQRGEAFGERLFYAAEDLLRLGYESLCLIDSDSPTLPRAALRAARAALSRPGDRLVLGPADDGGYYLIGLKRAHRRVFTEIEWSTAHVLAQSVARARELDLAFELLPAWYDVDDAHTLARLCDELFSARRSDAHTRGDLKGYEAPHTRAYLQRLIKAEGRARVWPETLTSATSSVEAAK